MSESKHTRAGRVRCAGCGIPISNPAESCPECAETKAGWTEMLEALRKVTTMHGYPDAPCGCDICAPVHAAIRKATGGEQ